jgi:hypothetical protein
MAKAANATWDATVTKSLSKPVAQNAVAQAK